MPTADLLLWEGTPTSSTKAPRLLHLHQPLRFRRRPLRQAAARPTSCNYADVDIACDDQVITAFLANLAAENGDGDATIVAAFLGNPAPANQTLVQASRPAAAGPFNAPVGGAAAPRHVITPVAQPAAANAAAVNKNPTPVADDEPAAEDDAPANAVAVAPSADDPATAIIAVKPFQLKAAAAKRSALAACTSDYILDGATIIAAQVDKIPATIKTDGAHATADTGVVLKATKNSVAIPTEEGVAAKDAAAKNASVPRAVGAASSLESLLSISANKESYFLGELLHPQSVQPHAAYNSLVLARKAWWHHEASNSTSNIAPAASWDVSIQPQSIDRSTNAAESYRNPLVTGSRATSFIVGPTCCFCRRTPHKTCSTRKTRFDGEPPRKPPTSSGVLHLSSKDLSKSKLCPLLKAALNNYSNPFFKLDLLVSYMVVNLPPENQFHPLPVETFFHTDSQISDAAMNGFSLTFANDNHFSDTTAVVVSLAHILLVGVISNIVVGVLKGLMQTLNGCLLPSSSIVFDPGGLAYKSPTFHSELTPQTHQFVCVTLILQALLFIQQMVPTLRFLTLLPFPHLTSTSTLTLTDDFMLSSLLRGENVMFKIVKACTQWTCQMILKHIQSEDQS
ncbi:hypothetical protein GOP47_0025994 [Adiantum capillus-veneris]|uniref:Uncharacterized protein n=2 Tax=Adiantum capillus-veneris TaxID=13818 RepID=A0A9D4U1H8_ADICA|nr:hypothetical protein GOP47_0025994 [Adiantum capillus-veneris]